MMSLNQEKIKKYESILKNRGQDGLYRYSIGEGFILFATMIDDPDIYILNMSEKFFALYRKTGENKHFVIGKILRRGAHSLYRQFLKMNNKNINSRFLNLVK